MEILLTGELISASEARSACESLVKKIMVNAPQAVSLCLQSVHRGLDGTQEEGQAAEASLFGLCCATEDMREGTTAFLEKRAPHFKGK